MKILVVDDEVVSRTKVQTIVESLGECEAVAGGKDAMVAFEKAMASRAPFDLITLDIAMPEMDGTDVLNKIREIEKEKNVPKEKRVKILMVSALRDQDSILSCAMSDCDGYIVKPFDQKKIIDKIERITNKYPIEKENVRTMKKSQENNNIQEFNKGQIIFKDGEMANCIYKIKSGSVIIYRVIKSKNVVLDKLDEGQIFGHMSVIPGERRSANAMAAEPSEFITFDQSTLSNFLSNSPVIIQDLTKTLAKRLKKTTKRVVEQQPSNIFKRICLVLDLMYYLHLNMPSAEARKIHDYGLGINYKELSLKVKDILQLSQFEIDQTLKRLHSINLIELTDKRHTDKKGKSKTLQRFVKILDQNKFLAIANRFYKEFEEDVNSIIRNQEFFDIHDFSRSVGSTPDIIYKKIAAGEIPENIFYIHMTAASEWVKEVGKEFFKKAKRRAIKIEDLEGIDDIIHVDNNTIQEALSKIGFYKTGVLATIAGNEARDKIFNNLSSNVVNIIKEEMSSEEAIDEIEAADTEGEFIETIKEMKKIGRNK